MPVRSKKKASPKSDLILPTYYSTGIPPIEIIRKCGLGFNLGNTIKYILRKEKATTPEERIQDLRKAQTYLQFEIDELEPLIPRRRPA